MTRRRPTGPSDIRGTNYYASGMPGTDNALGLLPKSPANFLTPPTILNPTLREGFFDARHNAIELEAIANAGFNNIRLWPSFFAWVADRQAFRSALSQVVSNCARSGLTVTYVVWSAVEATVDRDLLGWLVLTQAQTFWGRVQQPWPNWEMSFALWDLAGKWYARAAGRGTVPQGEPWFAGTHSEPGNYLFRQGLAFASWPVELRNLVSAYLADIAAVFSTPEGRSVLYSYDLWNEPDYDPIMFQSARTIMLDLAVRTQSMLLSITPEVRCTIGLAGLGQTQQQFVRDFYLRGGKLQYMSSHAYRTVFELGQFSNSIQDAKRFAGSFGLEYVCSEFWARWLAFPPPAPLAPYLNILRGLRVGGQMWCFLELNIFYRDAWELWRYDRSVVPIGPPRVGFQPIRTRLPQPEAIDGLVRPRRAAWSLLQPWVPGFALDRTAPQSDLDAVRVWTAS